MAKQSGPWFETHRYAMLLTMRVRDMTPAALKTSVSNAAPPADLAPTAQALWWAAKGDWDTAHKIVQEDESREAAWVHAYLHRVEGDLPNARYWYRTAGKPVAEGALDDEWKGIAAALLDGAR
jgi:hypothetical protein